MGPAAGLSAKLDTTSLYQTSFSETELLGQEEVARPERAGRREECYCLPIAQCPADKIVGDQGKDYSSLINPRVKNPQSDITAVGRSALEVTQEEEEDAEIEEEALEIVAEISRKRRQLQQQQEEEGSGAAVQVGSALLTL